MGCFRKNIYDMPTGQHRHTTQSHFQLPCFMGPFLLICDAFTRQDKSFCSACEDNADSFVLYVPLYLYSLYPFAFLHLPRKWTENTFRLLDKNESQETKQTDCICLDRVPLTMGWKTTIRSLMANLQSMHMCTHTQQKSHLANHFYGIIKGIVHPNIKFIIKRIKLPWGKKMT